MQNKKLNNYQFIETGDGSYTAFSEVYNEACHSTNGAIEETHLHYIQGCKIKEKANSELGAFILEVGFGVGIGFFETLKSLKNTFFTFVSMEIDEELIKFIIQENSVLKKIVRKKYYYELKNEEFHLIILIGNARETVKKFKNDFSIKFNCIYQDAFSPKRNSILWTKEWFQLLKEISYENCIMSTYSSSSSIRKSMMASGWKVYKGDKFGPKRSSTRARLAGETDHDILEHLERSPAILITDDNYKEYILENK